MTQHDKMSTTSAHMNHLLARRQRIEVWASRGRSSSIHTTASAASALLKSISAQRRSESTFTQASRTLDLQLLQLSEQRQKIIERRTFDQKIFANKQALKHKDNPAVLDTLSYVRKCSKYADVQLNDEENNNNNGPTLLSKRKSTTKRVHSRSPSTKKHLSANTSTPIVETVVTPNKNQIESCDPSSTVGKLIESQTTNDTSPVTMSSETQVDDNSQKRHVQFRINPDGSHLTSQSAHFMGKSHLYSVNKQTRRNINSAPSIRSSSSVKNLRSTKSAPVLRAVSPSINSAKAQLQLSIKSTRSLSRTSSSKNALQDFRLHPERYLSASNCYLPLLRRHAMESETKEKNDSIKKQQTYVSPSISRLSIGSDLTFDDAKSFLSEDNESGKYTPHSQTSTSIGRDRRYNKRRFQTKVDMMETIADDTSSHTMAMARLREREYARLNQLIHSDIIEKVIEPLSKIKTDELEQIDLKQQQVLKYKRQLITKITDPLPIKSTRARQLGDILRSIDSLSCSDIIDKRARREVDLEKNRAKLGILIF